LTTALKCIKKDYLVNAETIKNCSVNLEKELNEFKNKKVILLMGDFAIKAINYIWKRKYNEKAIPAGSTYKIRNGVYESNGIRFFPSYTQTGDSFGLEKSKVEMITDDIEKALKIINNPATSSGVCCCGKVSVSGFNTLRSAPRGGVLNPSHTIKGGLACFQFKPQNQDQKIFSVNRYVFC
jgi:hypothetical protein